MKKPKILTINTLSDKINTESYRSRSRGRGRMRGEKRPGNRNMRIGRLQNTVAAMQ
jgi:hypothetical protein